MLTSDTFASPPIHGAGSSRTVNVPVPTGFHASQGLVPGAAVPPLHAGEAFADAVGAALPEELFGVAWGVGVDVRWVVVSGVEVTPDTTTQRTSTPTPQATPNNSS